MTNRTATGKEEAPIIDENIIFRSLEGRKPDSGAVKEILSKALELKGLESDDISILSVIEDPDMLNEIFKTARAVKERIYGKRLVLFAPLYISNLCSNECLYCAFRARNTKIKRRALSYDEIVGETEILIKQGHKRILLVAGESYPSEGFEYILKAIDNIYKTKIGRGKIRRINVNIAPLDIDEFRRLKESGIGTYQLFQETYHHETYGMMHVGGKKRDYDWRITAMDRAMESGIDDVGIGVLFGLFDWRFEVLALMQHIRHLEHAFGVGPHTISVPRLEPAVGSIVAERPPYPVNDMDFKKIVALLRLAVPYTGIIMSTRETPEMRRETFALGVSQISAGSRTNPGGYGLNGDDAGQFALGDHRSLDEVIRDIAQLGYIPSFCTACYRLGRTGMDFMDMAKPGEIRHHCDPNAMSTFMEYLLDYGSGETRDVGKRTIHEHIANMEGTARKRVIAMIEKVSGGERDVFC